MLMWEAFSYGQKPYKVGTGHTCVSLCVLVCVGVFALLCLCESVCVCLRVFLYVLHYEEQMRHFTT